MMLRTTQGVKEHKKTLTHLNHTLDKADITRRVRPMQHAKSSKLCKRILLIE
jgi:hypothetical protein